MEYEPTGCLVGLLFRLMRCKPIYYFCQYTLPKKPQSLSQPARWN